MAGQPGQTHLPRQGDRRPGSVGDLLAWLGHEPAVRAMEQGHSFGLDDLSPATMAALGAVQDRLDAQPRDWARHIWRFLFGTVAVG